MSFSSSSPTCVAASLLASRSPGARHLSSSSSSSSYCAMGSSGAFAFSSSLSCGRGLCHVARSPPALLPIEAKAATRRENRQARHQRVRKKVEGTPDRPRMSVFRSNKHLYVQVIDDSKMHTLASASTMQKPILEEADYSCGPTIEVAKKVGVAIAKACLGKGITKVAFDRGGYAYHGRLEALADAAREHGLQF